MSALMIFLFVSLVILGLNALVQVEEKHFAITTIFGRRRSRILYEGLNLTIPLLERVKEENVFTLEEQKTKIEFSFFSGSRGKGKGGQLELNLTGLLKWRFDPTIKNKDKTQKGFPQFMQVLPETREAGLKSKVESEVSRLGGLHSWDIFRSKRRAVEHFINCILRLKIPPHADKKFLKELGNSSNPKESQYAEYAAMEIPREIRLQFYEDCSQKIGDSLRGKEEKVSGVEKAYGIKIIEFILGTISLSPEAKSSTEAKEIAQNQIQAMEQIHQQKIRMAKELTSLELSQAAVDSAELTLKQAEKKVISFEGISLKGLDLLLVGLVKKLLEEKEG